MMDTNPSLICANGSPDGMLGVVGLVLVILLLVLIGPVALRYGADSRRIDDRGWIGRR